MQPFVTIDGFKYAVETGTYIRAWDRQFTVTLSSNIIQVNYIDRGPGIENYSMTLLLATWDCNSALYKAGITQTADQQMANLEASYLKVAMALPFLDPYGQPPRNNFATGILFTDMKQILPNYSTVQKSYYKVQVTLQEGAGVVLL